jgi:hypothetical protein
MRNPAGFSGGRIRRRPKKGYGGTNKGFCPPAKRDSDADLKYVAPPKIGGTGAQKPAENAAHRKNSHLWMETK